VYQHTASTLEIFVMYT